MSFQGIFSSDLHHQFLHYLFFVLIKLQEMTILTLLYALKKINYFLGIFLGLTLNSDDEIQPKKIFGIFGFFNFSQKKS